MKTSVFKSYKDVAFYILFVIGVYTIISGLLTNKPFNWQIYAGIGTIFLGVFLYLIYYKAFKYFFVITLFVGLFNVIHFTFNITTISFYLGIFKVINISTVEVQLLSLLLLLLHGGLHRKWLWGQLKRLIFKTEEEKMDEKERQITMFKQQYAGMSKEELKKMINNKDTYSKEAIAAVERLLNK